MNQKWRNAVLIVTLFVSLAAGAVSIWTMQHSLPAWVEIQEGPVAHGVDKFYRNAYFKGNIETAGDLTVAGTITGSGAIDVVTQTLDSLTVGESTVTTETVDVATIGTSTVTTETVATSTITNAVVITITGENGETLRNTPDGEWDFGSANLDTSGDVDGDDINAGATADVGTWLNLSPQSNIVLADGGTITPTGTYQPVTSTDAVTTSTTTAIADGGEQGDLLIIHNDNVTFTIVIDGTGGNVECKSNISLVGQDDLTLFWDGSDWRCLSSYDNS
jgi:hypothetical protein